MSSLQRALTAAALALTFVVVVVGAYVRLSDAGLGCPDWPLCYGKPLPDRMHEAIADADALAKAWKEMGHRYLAGTLGILILAIFAVAMKTKTLRGLSAALLALVVFQATLGKWTVTMLLKPAIVTAHLLGGMAILALLLILALCQKPFASAQPVRALRGAACTALAVLVAQIALGGWVSANYAALACPDLPGCKGQVMPPMDFGNAWGARATGGSSPTRR
jgi:cytochrome c oxidase assembly protein subunit 15